ncbi:MAG: hypothetical protein IT269_01210 [Saprospiraceae bacterium]|nr:hypothetical protein [Saprospiraceae bacterium]
MKALSYPSPATISTVYKLFVRKNNTFGDVVQRFEIMVVFCLTNQPD